MRQGDFLRLVIDNSLNIKTLNLKPIRSLEKFV